MTRKEIAEAGKIIGPMLQWWDKVIERLATRQEWEIRDLAMKAHTAVHNLSVHLHYETVDGAGKVNDRPRELGRVRAIPIESMAVATLRVERATGFPGLHRAPPGSFLI
jgi:hypothetical protein